MSSSTRFPRIAFLPLPRSAASRLLFLLIAMVPACAPAVGANAASLEPQVRIVVDNQSAGTLRIYAVKHQQEVKLGRSEPMTLTSFNLPPNAAGTIQLVARIEGGAVRAGEHRSIEAIVAPGQSLVWRIQHSPGVTGIPQFSWVSILNDRFR